MRLKTNHKEFSIVRVTASVAILVVVLLSVSIIYLLTTNQLFFPSKPKPTPEVVIPETPTITTTIALKPYTIHGLTENELNEDKKRKGPKKNGQGYAAMTYYHFSPLYTLDEAQIVCSPGPVSILLSVSIHLPQWERPEYPRVERSLIEKWDTFHKNLLTHEYGHADIIESNIRRMLADLNTIELLKSCNDVRTRMNEIQSNYRRIIDKENEKYDEETKYGWTQDAYFH